MNNLIFEDTNCYVCFIPSNLTTGYAIHDKEVKMNLSVQDYWNRGIKLKTRNNFSSPIVTITNKSKNEMRSFLVFIKHKMFFVCSNCFSSTDIHVQEHKHLTLQHHFSFIDPDSNVSFTDIDSLSSLSDDYDNNNDNNNNDNDDNDIKVDVDEFLNMDLELVPALDPELDITLDLDSYIDPPELKRQIGFYKEKNNS